MPESLLPTETSSSTLNRRIPTSIRDSNAGHDFHVLWATRRVIEMLNPASGLRCVKMEGVSPTDTVGLAADEEHFLAADLTEYYEGMHFAEASRTVISQLKYSTRHPSTPWTKGRLSKRSSRTASDSVIQRLAASFLDLSQSSLRADLISKVRIRLVSNQPLSANLLGLWKSTQEALQGLGDTPTSIQDLLGLVPTEYHTDINDFATLLSLPTEQDFTDFLRVLDLSGCGEDTRMGQQLAMLNEIAPSVASGRFDALLRLTDLIRKEVLPEKDGSEGLTQADVLAALEVLNYSTLFPEPSLLFQPEELISTEEARNLSTAIIEASNGRVLAHGDAGVGKTTTVQQLHSHLPQGSVVVIYDCYGAGKYFSVNASRHTLPRAFLQLSNELAVLTGIPLLITAPTNTQDFIDHFEQRLAATASIVNAAGGLLIIAIDAADNSVAKAVMEGEKRSFVPHLWELTLPVNCRLLMTTRTFRADSLQAPASTVRFELQGFDLEASAAHLKQVFPGAAVRTLQAFHDRTSGNPRVQRYWLDSARQAANSRAAFFHIFRHAHLTPAGIFEDLIRVAVREALQPAQAQRQLATLICLQRPIPLAVFARACGIDNAEATNFCRALRPGLVFEDELITFRDEDFETHLRTRPETEAITAATHTHLGDHFRSLAATDAYAAQAVAEHYSVAERHKDLLDLVLQGPALHAIPDSLARMQAQRRRLALAMHAAAALRDDAAGARIMLLAAEAMRTNESVKGLVRANLDLADRFGDTETLNEVYDHLPERQWLGSVHYRLAALYARKLTTRGQGEEHLRQANAWVRRYMALPADERHNWRITDNDIAHGAEAVFWLHGVAAAQKWLSRWRPLNAVFRCFAILVENLVEYLSTEEVELHLAAEQFSLRAECVVLAVLWNRGREVSFKRVQDLAERLPAAIRDKKIRCRLDEWPYESTGISVDWPLSLAELFAFHRVDSETITLVLTELLPTFPDRGPLGQLPFTDFIAPLRMESLKAILRGQTLTTDELMPQRYRRPVRAPQDRKHQDDTYESGQRRGFEETIGLVLPFYLFRARALVGAVALPEIIDTLEKGLREMYTAPNRSHGAFVARQRMWMRAAGAALARLPEATLLLQRLFVESPRCVGRYQARELWLELATELLLEPSYQALGLRWIEKAADDAEQDALPVQERWKLLLWCAELAAEYDEDLCKDLYRRALTTANQGVGDDVAETLSVGAHLATLLAPHVTDRVANSLATELAALVEAYRFYVSSDASVPLDATVQAVASLSPVAGAALCGQWDSKNIYPLNESVISLVRATTTNDYWSAGVSSWLLLLAGETYDISYEAVRQLDILGAGGINRRQEIEELLTEFCNWVETRVPLKNRAEAMMRLKAWAVSHALERLPAVLKLTCTLDFIEELNSVSSPSKNLGEYALSRAVQEVAWQEKARLGQLDEFQRASSLHNELSPSALVECILELGNNVSTAKRIEVLELVSSMRFYPDGPLDTGVRALHGLLDLWRRFGLVQQWAATGISLYFSKHLFRLTGQDQWHSHLEELCTLPLADASRAALLLPGVATQFENLGPNELCRLAKALAQRLDYVQLQDLTSWLLARLRKQLEDDGKAIPFEKLVAGAEIQVATPLEALAQFAWSQFGHPDKRVRWQMVHAIRRMMAMSANSGIRSSLIARLIELSHTETAQLSGEGKRFFWMGARVWSLILFERLADEIPSELVPHVALILRHINNKNLPHAQIRGLARQTVLRLVRHDARILSPLEFASVMFANQPVACMTEKGWRVAGEELKLPSRNNKRFNFDQVDTLPYWFSPLGDVFGQNCETVAQLAEQWICDRWGNTEEEVRKHHKESQGRHDYALTDHRHGSEPAIENLRLHLTHHALMCVAGEWIDTLALPLEEDEEASGRWESWLEEHLVSALQEGWLSDLLGPAPLRPECWGKMPVPWDKKKPDDFLSALGIAEAGRVGWQLLYGHHTFGSAERYASVQVGSALIDPETAPTLMSALQLTKSDRYAFPTFGFQHSDGYWVDSVPEAFRVQPLVQEGSQRGKGLETRDSANRGLSTSFARPAEEFLIATNLVSKRNSRDFVDSTGYLIVQREVWEDDQRDEQDSKYEPYSSGQRIWMKRDALQQYLQRTGKDMVVEVILKRNYSSTTREDKPYDSGKHIIYLLGRNGTIQTLAGSCPPWTTHS
jgi:hypothetical protein